MTRIVEHRSALPKTAWRKNATSLRRLVFVEPKGQPPPRAPRRTMRGRDHARPNCVQPRQQGFSSRPLRPSGGPFAVREADPDHSRERCGVSSVFVRPAGRDCSRRQALPRVGFGLDFFFFREVFRRVAMQQSCEVVAAAIWQRDGAAAIRLNQPAQMQRR